MAFITGSAALALSLTAVSCVSTNPASPSAIASFNKPGFYTEVRDGRLWMLREGSKELQDFKKHGEPAHQVTRVGGGPNGMTIKSSASCSRRPKLRRVRFHDLRHTVASLLLQNGESPAYV